MGKLTSLLLGLAALAFAAAVVFGVLYPILALALERGLAASRRIGALFRAPRGFTLIEVMIAAAVLGVVASVAIPVSMCWLRPAMCRRPPAESVEAMPAVGVLPGGVGTVTYDGGGGVTIRCR